MVFRASPSAIEAAYRAHGHHVFRRAVRILGREGDARDVVQEVFVSLLDDPSQFGGKSSLATWLYSATTNRCLARLRDERTRARLLAERASSLPVAASAASTEGAAELRGLLARLPTELGRVAVYYYGDEMTQDEIAELLHCSRRHVGRLLEQVERAMATTPEAP